MKFEELESEQLRRIFRDFLKGVPKERNMKKYGLTESDFWNVIGLYHKPRRKANAEAKQPEAPKAPEAKPQAKASEAAKATTVLTAKPQETKR
jgi:hypothetical protein